MRARLDKAVRMPVMKVLIDFENTGFGSMDDWTDISDYVHEISASKQKEGEVLGGVSSDIVTLTVDNSTNAFSVDNPNSFFYNKQRSNLRFAIMAGFNGEELIPYMIGYVNSLKPTWKGKTYTLNCTCPIEKLKKAKVPKMSYKNVKWDFLIHELLDKAGIEDYFVREIPTTELNYSYFKFEEEKCFDALKKLMEAVCGVAYFDGDTFRVETQLAINYSKSRDAKHDLIADDFFEFEEAIDDTSVINDVTITAEPKEICDLEVVAKTPENITRVDNETTTYDGSGLVYIDRLNLPLYISNEHSEHGVTVENLTRGGTLEWSNYNVEEGYVRLKDTALSNVMEGDTLSLTYDYQMLTLLPNQVREYSLTCEDEVDAFLEPDVVAWNPSVTANIPYSSTPDVAGTISKQYAKLSDDKRTITIALKNNTNDKLSISTLQFRGYPVRVNNPIEVHAKDEDSIEVYDERESSIGNNYINNIRLAEKLAQFIIDNKSDIPKTLSVQISGYAELMLSDVCLVTETDSYTNHLMEIHQVDFTFNPNNGWLTTLSLIELPSEDWIYGGFDGDSIITKPPVTNVDPYIKSEEPPLDTSKIWVDTTTNKMYVYDSSTNTWIPMVGELPEDGVSKEELEDILEEEETAWKQEVNTYAERLSQGRELAILKGTEFPASAIDGQLFINTGDNNSMYRWNGTEWVKVGLSDEELEAIRQEIQGVADDLDDTLESLNQTKQDLIDTERELQQTDADLRQQAADLLAQTNGLQGSVSTINQTIDEINGQLDVTATKTEVETLVNGIKIGGRNLISDSDVKIGGNTVSPNNYTAISIFDTLLTPLKANKTYTFSSDIEILAGNPTHISVRPFAWYNGANTLDMGIYPNGNNAEIIDNHIEITFSIKEHDVYTANNLLVYHGIAGETQGNLINLFNYKLEEGTKATAWTLAPEDIQGDIRTIENNVTQNTLDIAVNATEISKRMTQTQVQNIVTNGVNSIEIGGKNLILKSNVPVTTTTEYLIKQYTMSEDWKTGETYTISIKGTLDTSGDVNQSWGIWHNGASTNITHLYASDADSNGIVSKTFTLTSNVVSYPRVLSIYNCPSATARGTTIDWVKLEKGNKRTDWTPAPEDTDAQFTTVTNRITHNENTLIEHADLILERLTQSQVETVTKQAIDNLQIGGRNLLLNTSDSKTIGSSTAGNYTYQIYVVANPPLTNGETYTFSANISVVTGSVTKCTVGYYDRSITTGEWVDSPTIQNGKITTTFTVQRDDMVKIVVYAGVGGSTAGNSITITNAKLEKGNKATDWTPAPEDTENQIEVVSTNVSNVTTELERQAGLISQRVTKEEYDVDMENFEARIEEAESYITETADGIEAVVREKAQEIVDAEAEDIKDEILGMVNSDYDEFQERLSTAESKIDEKADSITLSATKAEIENRILAKNNLILNGNGILGDATNVSGARYDGSVMYNGTPSFHNNTQSEFRFNEFIPVDPTHIYRFGLNVKTGSPVTTSQYWGFRCFDIDKQNISPCHVMYHNGSTTTLARELKNGDTKVYLTSIEGFNKSDSLQSHQRSLIFWNYKNQAGYQYPIETYSRNFFENKWTGSSSFNASENSITLTTAWTGGTFPAGTAVSQGLQGSTYTYCYLSGTLTDAVDDWKHLSGTVTGLNINGEVGSTTFRHGTAFIQICISLRTSIDHWINNVTMYDITQEKNANNYTVDQVEAAKAQLRVEADEIVAEVQSNKRVIDELGETTTSLSSRIDEKADSITLETAKTELKQYADNSATTKANTAAANAINNLQIGGVNLLLSTGTFYTPWGDKGTVSYVTQGAYSGGYAVYGTKYAWSGKTYSVKSLIDRNAIAENEDYTLSWYARGTSSSYLPNMAVYVSSIVSGEGVIIEFTDGSTNSNVGSCTTEWKRYSRTFRFKNLSAVTSDNHIIRIEATESSSGTDYLEIACMQLERGNKLTDYSVAPEDLREEISVNKAQIAINATNIGLSVRNETYQADKAEQERKNTSFDNRITVNEQGVLAAATKTQVAQDIKNIEPSSRNCILKSDFSANGNTGVWTFADGVATGTATVHQANGNYFLLNTSNFFRANCFGKTITFSMEYKVETALTYGTTNPWVGMQTSYKNASGNYVYVSWLGGSSVSTAVSDGWQKHTINFSISKDAQTSINVLNFYFRDTIGKVKFRNPMLVIGTHANGWQLAPEDTETRLVSVEESVFTILPNQISGKVSQSTYDAFTADAATKYDDIYSKISANTSSINAKVSSTEYNSMAIGGYNFLPNANFARTYENVAAIPDGHEGDGYIVGDLTSAHPNIYAYEYGGMNTGLTNYATIQHAHIDDTTFDFNCYVYDETDGNTHWKAIAPTINSNGDGTYSQGRLLHGTYCFSADIYVTGVDNADQRFVYGGFHFTKIGGTTTDFYGTNNWFTMKPKKLNAWHRVWVTVDLSETVDFNKQIRFYIYCYGAGKGKVFIKNVQLEYGNKPTAFGLGTDLDKKVASLESRVQKAEIEIQKDRIISTVMESELFAEMFDDKADKETLKDYSTLEELQEKLNDIDYAEKIDSRVNQYLEDPESNLNLKFVTQAQWENTKNTMNAQFSQANGLNFVHNSLGFGGVNDGYWIPDMHRHLAWEQVPRSGTAANITLGQYWVNIGARMKWADWGLKAGDWITFQIQLLPTSQTKDLRARINYSKEDSTDYNAVYGNTIAMTASPTGGGQSVVSLQLSEDYPYVQFGVANATTNVTTNTTEQYKLAKVEFGKLKTDWSSVTDEPYIEPVYDFDAESLGFKSSFKFSGKTRESTRFYQKVNLVIGKEYTLSCYYKNIVNGKYVDIAVYGNDLDTAMSPRLYNNELTDGYKYYYTTFTATESTGYVKLMLSSGGEAYFTGIMLHEGSIPLKWSQATGEQYNSNIMMDINGIKVIQQDDNKNPIGYTEITPKSFSGYYDTDGDGDYEEIFTLKEDAVVTKRTVATHEIIMGNLKFINLNAGGYTGWALVPSTANDWSLTEGEEQ